MKLATFAVSFLCAVTLFGCSQIPVRHTPKGMPMTASSAKAAASIRWDSPAVTREGSPMLILATPQAPPRWFLRKHFQVSFPKGVTLGTLIAALGEEGYSVVVMDPKVAGIPLYVPYYQGTMGGFLALVERAANVWFTWQEGTLVISKVQRIALSLPQDRNLANQVVSGLENLGVCVHGTSNSSGVAATALRSTKGLGSPTTTQYGGMYGAGAAGSEGSASSSAPESQPLPSAPSGNNPCADGGRGADAAGFPSAASWLAGMISLDVRPQQFRRAILFLRRITRNAAIVNLQVAMVDVTLNQNANEGIDWSHLQFALNGGQKNLLTSVEPSSTTGGSTSGTPSTGTQGASTGNGTSTNSSSTSQGGGQGGSGGSGGSSTGGATSLTWPKTGVGYLINDGTFRGVVSSAAFSMIGFFDFLDTYGQAKTLQSVMLRTVTGNEVELKSVTEIPYVSGVGIGTGYGSTGSSGSLLGSANTSTANDGIILKMAPTFDSASESVSIDMALSVDAVLGFNQLSAGNQIGSFTQPTTAERTFNDVIRVRPGQTVVVGGISYDQVARDDNVPLFLPDKAAHQSLTVKREAMFIVIRPTVTLLGALVLHHSVLGEGAAFDGPLDLGE